MVPRMVFWARRGTSGSTRRTTSPAVARGVGVASVDFGDSAGVGAEAVDAGAVTVAGWLVAAPVSADLFETEWKTTNRIPRTTMTTAAAILIGLRPSESPSGTCSTGAAMERVA